MLRKLRIALAVVFGLCVTALLLDGTGVLRDWFGWMWDLQLLPSLLVLAAGTVAVPLLIVFILTLLFGRVYCSVLCPLGIFQDLVHWISNKLFPHRKDCPWNRTPRREWALLRYGVWVLLILAIVLEWTSLIAYFGPESIYKSFLADLLGPLLGTVSFDAVALWTALGMLVLIVALAALTGRDYCNRICPVGTTLGLLSRISLFGPVIDASKCRHCHRCEKHCKAGCISIPAAPSATPDGGKPATPPRPSIDASRCISCMNCLDQCPFGALKFKSRL